MARWFRHGDLSFHRVASLPKGAKKAMTRVLAEGEMTGHMHVLSGDAQFFMDGSSRYLEVGAGGAIVQHIDQSGALTGEHDTVKVMEQGTYLIQQEQESDISGNDRRVVD